MKNEFDRRYGDKLEYLLGFFYDLQKFLESPEKEFYTQSDLDFACKSNNPIDFVTFDKDCLNGAKNVDILCFNSIKGKNDFTAS